MSTIFENLELIKKEKETQKAILSNEFGEEIADTPFTQFSTKFGQSINEKQSFKDVISSTISKLDEKYSCNQFDQVSVDLVNGKYLLHDGSLVDGEISSAYVTEYVEVVPYEKLRICSEACFNAFAHAFYDKDKNTIEIFPNVEPGSGNVESSFVDLEVEVPENARFARASTVYTGKPSISRVKNEKFANQMNNEILDLSSNAEFNKQYTTLVGENSKYFIDSDESIDVTDQYSMQNGWWSKWKKFNEDSSSRSSSPIDLLSADGLYFTGNAQWDAVCFVYEDKNNKAIATSKAGVAYTDYKIIAADILKEYPEARYIVFSSLSKEYALKRKTALTNSEILASISKQFGCSRGEYKTFDDYVLCTNYYLDKTSGGLVKCDGYVATDFIDFSTNKKLRISTKAEYNTCGICLFNGTKTKLSSSITNTTVDNYEIDFDQITADSGLSATKYIRLGGTTSKFAVDKFHNFSIDEMYDDLSAKIDGSQTSYIQNLVESRLSASLQAMDCMYGKKYVSLGDSFTSEGVGTTTPYPDLIASRHGMVVKNLAVSGSRMSNPSGDISSIQKYFPLKYPSVSADIADADYVTMSFGLNETGDESISGTTSSNDTTTIFGAWNVMLEKILSSNPDVKIGIVVADSYTPDWQANLLEEIGSYWGIPVLDMKNGKNVPMMMGGRTGCNEKAKTIRSQAFTIPTGESGEGHPNQAGQYFRSTVIENFMKSL